MLDGLHLNNYLQNILPLLSNTPSNSQCLVISHSLVPVLVDMIADRACNHVCFGQHWTCPTSVKNCICGVISRPQFIWVWTQIIANIESRLCLWVNFMQVVMYYFAHWDGETVPGLWNQVLKETAVNLLQGTWNEFIHNAVATLVGPQEPNTKNLAWFC